MDFYSPTGDLHHIPDGALIAVGAIVIVAILLALRRNHDSWYN